MQNLHRVLLASRTEESDTEAQLVFRVFLEDLEAESISKEYAEIKRQELESLEKGFRI